tara:strand:- start:331 stop:534 length:204 start_codon:yes stop_codon:yes gene_type:complete
VADSVLGSLRKKLRKQMNDLADAMSVGSCTDYEQYRQMVGMIEGLAWAEREILDLEEKMNDPNASWD